MKNEIKYYKGQNFTVVELPSLGNSIRNSIPNVPGKLRVLQLPEGTDKIEKNLLANTDVEKVVLPASVKIIY